MPELWFRGSFLTLVVYARRCSQWSESHRPTASEPQTTDCSMKRTTEYRKGGRGNLVSFGGFAGKSLDIAQTHGVIEDCR